MSKTKEEDELSWYENAKYKRTFIKKCIETIKKPYNYTFKITSDELCCGIFFKIKEQCYYNEFTVPYNIYKHFSLYSFKKIISSEIERCIFIIKEAMKNDKKN